MGRITDLKQKAKIWKSVIVDDDQIVKSIYNMIYEKKEFTEIKKDYQKLKNVVLSALPRDNEEIEFDID